MRDSIILDHAQEIVESLAEAEPDHERAREVNGAFAQHRLNNTNPEKK
jgi:hypothetical protein